MIQILKAREILKIVRSELKVKFRQTNFLVQNNSKKKLIDIFWENGPGYKSLKSEIDILNLSTDRLKYWRGEQTYLAHQIVFHRKHSLEFTQKVLNYCHEVFPESINLLAIIGDSNSGFNFTIEGELISENIKLLEEYRNRLYFSDIDRSFERIHISIRRKIKSNN